MKNGTNRKMEDTVMKKSLFIGLVILLGLTGCTRNQEIEIKEDGLALFARTESPADTKTVVESGTHVFWEPGDEIAVFMGEKSAKFTTDLTSASASATFKGTFGEEAWPEELDLWAVYPFAEDAVFDGETITTTLPSEQIAREGSFGKDMNLSIAHSASNTLQFYNVGGGIRFSVTEAGVKKVMFEGLSGEIISGKVKIGFEGGLPVVKEVTSGSQFITLLPPSGQETFKPETWYYIVAIPGALEGGYKLRFYKDDDYARKISEKAVQIKRSIYGNIEKADKGIDYEAQTTHFPETKEDLIESAKLTEEITSTLIPCVSSIVEDMDEDLSDVERVRERLLEIDGIVEATICENKDVILIKQKDGVHLNVLLHTFLPDGESLEESASADLRTPLKQKANQDRVENRTIPDSRKAIILAPMQFHCKARLSSIKSYLSSVGYKVDCFENEAADITKFKASFLENYDVILIESHGGTGCYSPSGKTIFNLDSRSIIFSGTKYHYDNFDAWIDNWFGDWGASSEFWSLFTTDAVIGISKDGTYLAMTVDDLEGGSFDNAFVFLVACESGAYLTGDQSFIQSFLDKRAGAVLGFNKTIDVWYGNDFLDQLVDGMTQGLCLSVASTYVKTKPYMLNSDNGDSFVYKKANDERYYLVNPLPCDLQSRVDGNSVTLEFSHHVRNSYYEYSIYVDDVFRQKGYPDNPITIDVIPNGKREHKWYVVAKYYLNGDHYATYQSEEGKFTVADTPSDGQVLTSRNYNGKTYSIIRKNVSSTDCRINGDGSKFYACSYSVKVGGETYNLPGSFYSYTDRNFRDTGPVMAVNTQTGKAYVFLIEKDTDETYGMCGYVFTLSNGSISQQTVFTYANFGWFPYFEWYSDQFLLNMFSYAGYFSIIAPQNEDWALYYNEDIYPDDFLALQQQHDLIYIR